MISDFIDATLEKVVTSHSTRASGRGTKHYTSALARFGDDAGRTTTTTMYSKAATAVFQWLNAMTLVVHLSLSNIYSIVFDETSELLRRYLHDSLHDFFDARRGNWRNRKLLLLPLL